MEMNVVIWIIGGLVTALSAWFWYDRNNLQKRIEKIESDMSDKFDSINEKLAQIQQEMASEMAIGKQRPLESCRNYVKQCITELQPMIKDTIELTLRRWQDREKS